ncbi:MAG: EI24 domain-containing protein [Bacteroidetes bacterium]|nr:EI24 domain-containing protein [Bacteroidota bacterium]
MNNFIYGFFYPLRCIKLFFRFPKLIVYSIVPMVLNLVIYGAIFFYTYDYITGKSSDLFMIQSQNGLFFEFIKFFFKVFSFILVLLICYLAFIIFGGIISAPFNDLISKLIEEKLYPGQMLPAPETGFIKEAADSIKEELKKIFFYLSFLIPVLLLNLIPMIGNTLSLISGTLFSFYYNALDYMDYPMSRRNIKFGQKLKAVNSEKTVSAGFGAVAFILTFLPVINVILNPLLVVSGTSLFFTKEFNRQIL